MSKKKEDNVSGCPRLQTITITLPVCDFEVAGYGVSGSAPPENLLNRRLTRPQGWALARVLLGMKGAGECLNATEFRQSKEVTKRDEVVPRMLELIWQAIESADAEVVNATKKV